MPRVVFTPSGLDATVDAGITVLDAARRLGVDLDSVCGGRGICGRCAVCPGVGSFPKWAITVDSEPVLTSSEVAYAARKALNGRLACQLTVDHDAVYDVPPTSQVHRPIVRKSVDVGDLVLDPLVRLTYVEVERPELGDDRSTVERMGDFDVPIHLLNRLVREGGCTVAAVGRRVVGIWPGFVETVYGVAIDIGSTTVAGHLCDLHTGEVVASGGIMNPQIRFGEDLMSRVSFVMMNPGGELALTAAIRCTLNELIAEVAAAAGIGVDRVVDVVLVGNPIMHHIVLGIDPTPLGTAPFDLAVSTAVRGNARDIGLDLDADLYVGPCIAGHVGADTAAAILSQGPHRSSQVQLLVDIGTNAEIVLGNDERVYAASSPTGPAFEGAQISCGQRATVGAIERVRIDRDTLEPTLTTIGGAEPTGICGSGIIEVMAELFLSGILRADGTFDPDAPTERLVVDGRTYAYVLHGELRITQNDVRAIQLAKSALRAGIELLRDRSGLNPTTIRLAGAFGSHIDPKFAQVIGLIPDCDDVRSAGNAAGSGAVRALLSASQRAEMEAVVRTVIKIETALEPDFQRHFVMAMRFGDTTAQAPRRRRRTREAS